RRGQRHRSIVKSIRNSDREVWACPRFKSKRGRAIRSKSALARKSRAPLRAFRSYRSRKLTEGFVQAATPVISDRSLPEQHEIRTASGPHAVRSFKTYLYFTAPCASS